MATCKECEKRPSFGIPGTTKAEYCFLHKKEGMKDVHHKSCLECDIRATYGKKNTAEEYCVTHKKDGMINVVSKLCLECDKRPCFGFPGTTNAEYCSLHKKEDMINVRDKPCLECDKLPAFGYPGTKQMLYCASHKKQGMVNVKTKKCKECDTVPVYGELGTKIGLYCEIHKKYGMVNIKYKKCLDCDKHPTFGKKGTKIALYCALHKKDDMINVKNKPCLECDKLPSFGYPGTKNYIYCESHKKQGMVNIKTKTCKNDWCDTQAKKNKYEGYCYFCFVHMFPHHELTKSYKTKEKAVVDFVKTEFSDIDFICDKQIYDGCSKKRPDMFADFGDWVLIIEVDENEHTGYTCENKRLMQLSQDIDHRPLTMIRFNPDKYTKDDVKVASCWRNTKNGTKLVSTKTDEWTERLERLKRRIQRVIDNPSDQTIKLYNLFFSK
jgi:hypothetical protein